MSLTHRIVTEADIPALVRMDKSLKAGVGFGGK